MKKSIALVVVLVVALFGCATPKTEKQTNWTPCPPGGTNCAPPFTGVAVFDQHGSPIGTISGNQHLCYIGTVDASARCLVLTIVVTSGRNRTEDCILQYSGY
jgi:hypothetical protein